MNTKQFVSEQAFNGFEEAFLAEHFNVYSSQAYFFATRCFKGSAREVFGTINISVSSFYDSYRNRFPEENADEYFDKFWASGELDNLSAVHHAEGLLEVAERFWNVKREGTLSPSRYCPGGIRLVDAESNPAAKPEGITLGFIMQKQTTTYGSSTNLAYRVADAIFYDNAFDATANFIKSNPDLTILEMIYLSQRHETSIANSQFS